MVTAFFEEKNQGIEFLYVVQQIVRDVTRAEITV